MIEALIKRSQGRMYRGYARVFVRAHGDASDYPHELAFLSSVVINEEPTEYEDSFGQPHVVEVRSECLLRFHQFGTHERSFFYDEAVRKPMDYRVAFYAKALEKDAMLLREYENQYASAKAVQENSPYYEVRLSGLFTPLEAESLFEEFSTPELPDIESPLFDEILPPTTLYPTIQVLSDDGALLTVRIFDDNGLVEEFVDLPPSSGLLLPNGRRRFNLTMTQSVSNGSRYRIVAFSRRLNRRSLERESLFRSGIAVPELSYSSPHVYVNPLPVTLSLVTNATQYQLRWRRVGSSAWNEFLPQPPSNRTFTIPPSALDDALIVSFGIEVQGRAFNDVVSSAWSAPQPIEIEEPDFTMTWSSPAPPATIVQEFGFPIKQYDVNLSRTPANSERIDLEYVPTPQVDPALDFKFRDFVGNSFTGGNVARVRFDFASAATQNPLLTTYSNHKVRANSKYATVQRELSFDVEVKDRFIDYAIDNRCLLGVDMFGARRNGAQPHVETNSSGQIQVVRSFGSWGLSLQNPTATYRPILSFDINAARQMSFHQFVSSPPPTRRSLGASINHSGLLTLVISVRWLGGKTMAGAQSWFLEYDDVPNAFSNIGGIGNIRKNGVFVSNPFSTATAKIATNELCVLSASFNASAQTTFAIGGAQFNISTGHVGRTGGGDLQIYQVFLFSGVLATSDPAFLSAVESYCMEVLGI